MFERCLGSELLEIHEAQVSWLAEAVGDDGRESTQRDRMRRDDIEAFGSGCWHACCRSLKSLRDVISVNVMEHLQASVR